MVNSGFGPSDSLAFTVSIELCIGAVCVKRTIVCCDGMFECLSIYYTAI